MMMKALSLTPRFNGVRKRRRAPNRFSGLSSTGETAKAVPAVLRPTLTPLKRGANESGEPKHFCRHA
jgi:hypothetical protein